MRQRRTGRALRRAEKNRRLRQSRTSTRTRRRNQKKLPRMTTLSYCSTWWLLNMRWGEERIRRPEAAALRTGASLVTLVVTPQLRESRRLSLAQNPCLLLPLPAAFLCSVRVVLRYSHHVHSNSTKPSRFPLTVAIIQKTIIRLLREGTNARAPSQGSAACLC